MDNHNSQLLTPHSSLPTPHSPLSAATIGSFDGVHRGHRFVMEQLVGLARQRGLAARVITFSNHPLQVLHPDVHPLLLTPTEEKVELLRQTGIDQITLLDFTPELAQMTAHDFMRSVLKEQWGVQVLMMGYDNHFGHDHKSMADYRKEGETLGIEVVGCQECAGEEGISSTAIRQALLDGRVEKANTLLGYPYFLQGTVVAGFQNGRRLGYPTANLQVYPQKLIPQNGVYLVKCFPMTSKGEMPTGGTACAWDGMLNIGTRPTLHNGQQRSIEVHLFGFDGDLYGKTLRIQLLQHLRGEREFRSLDELKVQLEEDEKRCKQLIT